MQLQGVEEDSLFGNFKNVSPYELLYEVEKWGGKHPIQKVNGPDQRSNIDEERYFLHLRYNGDCILFWG